MLYPLTFSAIVKDRLWGSELWTISDRPGDESVVANGALAGTPLGALMSRDREALLGRAFPAISGRFPLLCKILNCRETLSVQVHPPAHRARELGGEPKTEMWYVADAAPGAELFVGLKPGVTRDEFERRLATGNVADALHRIPVTAGDTMFLPSGRVHAIGAGLVIVEIQQNSDTTYRVFDWNRTTADGTPRDLHVRESLASIDFNDTEPALVVARTAGRSGSVERRVLVRDPLFNVDLVRASVDGQQACAPGTLRIVANVKGRVVVSGGGETVTLAERGFCLIPASVPDAELRVEEGGEVLIVEAGIV